MMKSWSKLVYLLSFYSVVIPNVDFKRLNDFWKVWWNSHDPSNAADIIQFFINLEFNAMCGGEFLCRLARFRYGFSVYSAYNDFQHHVDEQTNMFKMTIKFWKLNLSRQDERH